jgi:RHS repeat-associated protein
MNHNYSYNGDQQLTMAQQEQQSGGNTVANKEIDYSYNAVGQFTAIGYYDQLSGPRTDIATGAFTYDTDGRLTGLGYTANGGQTTIDTYGWGYNAGSLVTSFTSNDGTASYGYDPTNQLTSATYTTNSGGHQPANESYSFTANGNRNMTGYSTGSDNLTSSDGTYNYGYDADGNLVSRTQIANTYSTDYKTTYTWDYRNRLTDVENFDNNGVLTRHVHYVYDVFDHLVATEVDTTGDGTYNVIDHYVLDVSPEIPAAGVPGMATAQPDLVFDGNQNLIGRNLVALDPAGVDGVMIEGTVTSTSQADTDQYNLFDDLGSLRIIVNNASATLDRIVYNSSGLVAYESSPTVAHFAGFAGGHVDPYTGLVNDYLRWYDPATGKWLSQDPVGFAAGDTDLSRYVGNSPTNAADRTGLRQTPFGPPFTQPSYREAMLMMAELLDEKVQEIEAAHALGFQPPYAVDVEIGSEEALDTYEAYTEANLLLNGATLEELAALAAAFGEIADGIIAARQSAQAAANQAKQNMQEVEARRQQVIADRLQAQAALIVAARHAIGVTMQIQNRLQQRIPPMPLPPVIPTSH